MDLVDGAVVTIVWSIGIAAAFVIAVDALRVRIGATAALWVVLAVAFWPVGVAGYALARRRHLTQKHAFAAVDGRSFELLPRADVMRTNGKRLVRCAAAMLVGLLIIAFNVWPAVGAAFALFGLLVMAHPRYAR